MDGEAAPRAPREVTPGERLQLLLDTIAEVASTLELDTLLDRIVDRSLELTGAERGILILRSEDDAEFVPQVARDASGRNLPLDLAFGRSVVNDVLATLAPHVHEVALSDSVLLDVSASVRDIGLRRLMCVPLLGKGELLGAAYVDSSLKAPRPFSADDLRLLQALAQHAAIAIVNARLRDAELENEVFQERLRIAEAIQRRSFPPSGLLLPGFDVYGFASHCERMGGDFFDYVPRPGKRWGLVVGDVVGHGLEAALYMLATRGGLRSSLSWVDDAPRVLEHLNQELGRDMAEGDFVTLLYVDLDVVESTFRFVAAGHHPPLLYRACDDAFAELSGGASALGIEDTPGYRTSDPVALAPGDVLVLYTDGIPESRRHAEGPQGFEFFGDERLRASVRRHRGGSSREVVEGVLEDLAAFLGGGEPDDDVTVVVATTTGE